MVLFNFMSIKVLITGDYCPIGRNKKTIENGDYTSFFGEFKNVVDSVDYAVTNLESPITSSQNLLLKSGPNIKGPIDGVLPLKMIGFNLATLANNHILDYQEKGVSDTLEFCAKNNIATVGAGSNLKNARRTYYKEIKGKVFAFINIAENEFCAATDTSYGANPLNLINNHNDITEAKAKSDYIIVIPHGGREHYQLPTPQVRERYRFFIDCGADVVVGHHPHCYGGVESYQNKKIFYSLGNFIFDYKPKYQKGHWTEGMAIILKFDDTGINYELIPFYQGRTKSPNLELMTGKSKDSFDEKIERLNSIIANDKAFEVSWENYITTQIKGYNGLLFVKNKYLRALFVKGLLPFINIASKNRKALLLNIYRCETHKEIMIDVLKREIGE